MYEMLSTLLYSYKYENGDVFDGEFLNNLPQGDGNFIDSEGLKQKITILDNIIVR